MKTIISIPDSTYESANKLAERLGISRSQLYTNAVETFIDIFENGDVKDQLDFVYKTNTEASHLGREYETLQSQSLEGTEW